MRSFVAIPVPDDAADRLAEVAAALGAGRAVPPENMHVTLAFLDDQPEQVLSDLSAQLSAIDLPRFEMRIRGLDVFGGRRPRLLIAGVETSEPLEQLRGKVRAAARAAGITLPRARFRPHVTLARFRRDITHGQVQRVGAFLASEAAFSAPPFTVRQFAVYQSRLDPGGARYQRLAEVPLAG